VVFEVLGIGKPLHALPNIACIYTKVASPKKQEENKKKKG